ncbi:MAG: family 16 glycoside hydrolase [Candidatus Aminicenantales bacterium]
MKRAKMLLLSLFWFSSLMIFSRGESPVDYAEVKIKKFPLAMQAWTYRRYTFVEAIEKTRALGIRYLQAYPGQVLASDDRNSRFDHNLTGPQLERVRLALSQAGVEVVSYGVVDCGRDEASMRRVFDFARQLGISIIVTEPRDEDFPILEKLVQEYDIQIAIHNHPEPSRYAKPETVLEKIKNLDPRIGACADTGHWMRGLRVPTEALRLLKGRVIDVHLKDRSDFGTGQGIDDVPFGKGKANIRNVLAELTLQNYGGYLTIEYENEAEVLIPEPAIQSGITYLRQITYYEDYEEILRRSRGRYSKHGWNHYGPGHFELDEREGILKSQGGMGLFWYSAKKFKDFILELDYRCEKKNTNSGVFLRVPFVPTSDDYIYHSFEVQINDAGQGIHQTGAIYDAEAPRVDASRPTGEWNHLKITFQGKLLQVELNGQLVIDWTAEPRGKVRDFAEEGYIGLQNHDNLSPVYFRNILIRELSR